MTLRRWQNIGKLGLQTLSRWPSSEIAKVNFALTSRCNHKCATCAIWQQHSTDELTVRDVGGVLQNNPRIMWAGLTGGEPSLANDFEEIVYHCVNRLPLTNIITNGQLPERIADSVAYALKQTPENHLLIVHITLLGEEHVQNEMTGIKDSYEKAVKTAQLLKELNHKDRLTVGFEHLISRYNPGEYKFVQYKANRIGVGITYTLEQFNGYYGNNGKEEHKPLYEIPRVSLSLNPIDQFKNTFLLNSVRKAGCVAGEYSCWVMPDKKVYPCFFSIPEHPSFDLNTTNYKLRKQDFAINRKFIEECKGCWTPCFPKGTKIVALRERLNPQRQPSHFRSTKKIEDIKIGDLVLSFNKATSEKEYKKVTQIHTRKSDIFIDLGFSNNNNFSCTPEHPVFVAIRDNQKYGQYIKAKDLKIGDGCIQVKYSGISTRLINTGRTLADIYGSQEKAEAVKNYNRNRMILNNPILNPKVITRTSKSKSECGLSEEHRKNIGKGSKKAWLTNINLQNLRNTTLTRESAIEREKRAKESNPNYAFDKLKNIKNVFDHDHMNKTEKRLSYILREICPHEFAFNGSGRLGVSVGHRIPDFWNINGKKKVIELFGDYWHSQKLTKIPDEQEVSNAINAYKKIGVDCLVIWERELKNEQEVKDKILKFVFNPNIDIVYVTKIKQVDKGNRPVYNLEVENNNNYFAYGILVHNCESYTMMAFRPWRILPKERK